jgi:hypothetical protein
MMHKKKVLWTFLVFSFGMRDNFTIKSEQTMSINFLEFSVGKNVCIVIFSDCSKICALNSEYTVKTNFDSTSITQERKNVHV